VKAAIELTFGVGAASRSETSSIFTIKLRHPGEGLDQDFFMLGVWLALSRPSPG
jgi:hypothetical protein